MRLSEKNIVHELQGKIYECVRASIESVRPDANLYSAAARVEISKKVSMDIYDELSRFFAEDCEKEEGVLLIEE